MAAQAGDCPGDRRRGKRGFGAPVRGGVQGAFPAAGKAGKPLGKFAGRKHARVELVLFGQFQPVGEIGHAGIAVADIEHAALVEAGVLADLGIQGAPDAQAFHDQRNLLGRAALLAHETPVPAGLLARDPALLAEQDRDSLAGQEIGGRDADDAAAHDNDVDAFGQCGQVAGVGMGHGGSLGAGWQARHLGIAAGAGQPLSAARLSPRVRGRR